MNADIIVVDDERQIRESVAAILRDEGYGVRTAACDSTFEEALRNKVPTAILLDIWLKGCKRDGLDLLASTVREFPDVPVIMISGHGTIEDALKATRIGAYDYLEKPFGIDRLRMVVRHAIERTRLQREISALRLRNDVDLSLDGASQPVVALRSAIQKVSESNARVLLMGQPGTGREEAARAIHHLSRRASAPFRVITAAELTAEDFDRIMFGSGKGGGEPWHTGLMESARGGSLYIHEVADLPAAVQGRLLRMVCEPGRRREDIRTASATDVRILSSTAVDLAGAVADGRFRTDLYHRLAVVTLSVPSLSERVDDLELLIERISRQVEKATGLRAREWGREAMAALQFYAWPGNLWQLRNTVERVMIKLQDDPVQEVKRVHLPEEIIGGLPAASGRGVDSAFLSLSLREARMAFERRYLVAQINRFGGNVTRTADHVGMERSALHRKLKALGVADSRGESAGD